MKIKWLVAFLILGISLVFLNLFLNSREESKLSISPEKPEVIEDFVMAGKNCFCPLDGQGHLVMCLKKEDLTFSTYLSPQNILNKKILESPPSDSGNWKISGDELILSSKKKGEMKFIINRKSERDEKIPLVFSNNLTEFSPTHCDWLKDEHLEKFEVEFFQQNNNKTFFCFRDEGGAESTIELDFPNKKFKNWSSFPLFSIKDYYKNHPDSEGSFSLNQETLILQNINAAIKEKGPNNEIKSLLISGNIYTTKCLWNAKPLMDKNFSYFCGVSNPKDKKNPPQLTTVALNEKEKTIKIWMEKKPILNSRHLDYYSPDFEGDVDINDERLVFKITGEKTKSEMIFDLIKSKREITKLKTPFFILEKELCPDGLRSLTKNL